MTDSIAAAYRAGAARAFFAGHYADRAARDGAVRRAARPLAPAVAAALETQNARLPPSAAREAHLAALRRGAAAVVTGQQVGLFLGPLFTVYKAASAVRVARALSAESGAPVVPVFWLQTEDHDFDEVAQVQVPSPGGAPLTLLVPEPASETRVAMAHRRLPEAVDACLEQLGDAVGDRPRAAHHLARLARHYRPGTAWGTAFAGVLAELYADEGLVIVDPRDAGLGAAAAPVHERALTAAEPIAAALAARGEALVAAGFSVPVHVRAGAPLSYYHPRGPAGPRHRLAAAADGFAEVGGDGVHTRAGLLDALAADPLRFSTSALLRPILQDVLLPTAAYVAGPGEVAYYAQLAPLYDAYELPMPIVVPRASFRLLDDGVQRTLERLGLCGADGERAEDELLAQVRTVPPLGAAAELAHVLLEPFERALDEVAAPLHEAGPGMGAALDKTRASVASAVGRLTVKYERAWLHRDQDVLDQVRRVTSILRPNGTPQERCYGLAYFAAGCGDRELVERIVAAVAPFDPTIRDLDATLPAHATEREARG